MHILIVGNGSIGKRHARNLKSLGCDISIVDPRMDRREELDKEMEIDGHYLNLEDALELDCPIPFDKFDGVVISTPPADHVEQCLKCIEVGIPIYLEKGVSLDYPTAITLELEVFKKNHLLLMGYSWRWWPSIQKLEELMPKVGQIRRVEMVIAAHLADWHPWERYQDFYIASRGGVENESHWIDLMLKWWDFPTKIFSRLEHISDLETTTNDNLEMWCEYPEHRVHIHFDLYARPHEKYIKIVGEEGTLHWEPNHIAYDKDTAWTDKREDIWVTGQVEDADRWVTDTERNEMFMVAAKEFLAMIEGKVEPSCTIVDGTNVMRLLGLARISHNSGKMVDVPK